MGLTTLAMPFSASAEDTPKEPIQVAQLDVSPQQVSFSGAAQGKPVQLIHGSGFSALQADIVQQTIENAGCPVSSRILGDKDRMMVRVDGEMVIYTDDMGEATGEAIEHCVPGRS